MSDHLPNLRCIKHSTGNAKGGLSYGLFQTKLKFTKDFFSFGSFLACLGRDIESKFKSSLSYCSIILFICVSTSNSYIFSNYTMVFSKSDIHYDNLN